MRRLPLLLLCIAIVFVLNSCGTDSGGPNPQITSLQPGSGPPGTVVTINGSGFSSEPSNNSVTFGGTDATVNSATESSIETEVPSGLSKSSVPVEVTVGDKTATGPSFNVEMAAPGISSVEPGSGTVGTNVTIKGMNFSATASENSIEFNGTPAPVNSVAKDQLTTQVPQGATDGPISVVVNQERTTGPDFDVITEGTLKLVTSTSGSDKDSDGYTADVDGSTKSAGNNDTIYFANLEEGTYDAGLSGVAQNCSVSGSNPRSVSISAGDTSSTTFDVSCDPLTTNKIVFDSDRDGGDLDIYIMNTDGSSQTRLTTDSGFDFGPEVSPDGTKILFTSERDGNREIYTMDSDGSNFTRITNNSAEDEGATWSPDGSKIAFISSRDQSLGELYIMNADGSSVQRLTNNSTYDQSPAWSPDGSKIAFESRIDGDDEIYTINPDGSGMQQVTNTAFYDRDPNWSPDGSKIAFRSDRDGDDEIYTINPDGTGLQQLTNNSARDAGPAWSPDGEHIIFQSDLPGNRDIFRMTKVGSNLINLTNDPDLDGRPAYGPQK